MKLKNFWNHLRTVQTHRCESHTDDSTIRHPEEAIKSGLIHEVYVKYMYTEVKEDG